MRASIFYKTMEQHSIAPSPGQKFTCPYSAMDEFRQRTAGIKPQVLRVNVLTLGNAILAGILVGIGTYGSRYRHRAFVQALFQGATTLFLPILSYVVSSASAIVFTFPQSTDPYGGDPSEIAFAMACVASTHMFVDLILAGLVNIVGIITCTMVAATDREGRNIGLPMALLAQAIWSSYLVVSLTPETDVSSYLYILLPTIFALFFAKVALRYYAFLKARRSVALGNNPPLIVGYMEQLRKRTIIHSIPPQIVEHCPRLIVTGEYRHHVEKVPHGFFFKWLHHNQDDMTMMSNCSGLVTVDRIWLSEDKILTSTPWLKDLFLSFSLFKLLRCRFAGYTIAEAGFEEAYNFFLHVLLKDKDNHERVYGVITNELSFLHDYYYSSIPIHYSNFLLPILNIFVSLLTITYCLLLVGLGIPEIITDMNSGENYRAQVSCWITCQANASDYENYDHQGVHFGNIAFDGVPVAILVVLVVLAEAREIATYICSNWTKVGLICRYAQKWQGSPSMQDWIGRVLRCRCKLMKHWDDKMNQCSVLVLHPRRRDQIVSLISHLLHLPANGKSSVKVPRVVKAAIVNALRSSSNNNNGFLADPTTFLRQSLQDRRNNFLWASDGKGIADIILMWHIATGILGLRRRQQQPPTSDDRIVATHLSRYCAYLVAYMPELLPDYDKWSRGLYMAIKKDSIYTLAAGRTSALPAVPESLEYDKVVSLLQERAENEVLRNGVKLAKELVGWEGEEAAWSLLAGFWSQMILYVAPSENLNGHADAIARGGELITFVWALLMHAGIARRPATGERV